MFVKFKILIVLFIVAAKPNFGAGDNVAPYKDSVHKQFENQPRERKVSAESSAAGINLLWNQQIIDALKEIREDHFKATLTPLEILCTIFVALFIWYAKRKFEEWQERESLATELYDMLRHYTVSKRILGEMLHSKFEPGIPALMHFHKLRVPENTLLFSPDTYRKIGYKHGKIIYRLKLITRNINLEIDEIISYLQGKNVKKELLTEFISDLEGKITYSQSRAFQNYMQLRKKVWQRKKSEKEIYECRKAEEHAMLEDGKNGYEKFAGRKIIYLPFDHRKTD